MRNATDQVKPIFFAFIVGLANALALSIILSTHAAAIAGLGVAMLVLIAASLDWSIPPDVRRRFEEERRLQQVARANRAHEGWKSGYWLLGLASVLLAVGIGTCLWYVLDRETKPSQYVALSPLVVLPSALVLVVTLTVVSERRLASRSRSLLEQLATALNLAEVLDEIRPYERGYTERVRDLIEEARILSDPRHRAIGELRRAHRRAKEISREIDATEDAILVEVLWALARRHERIRL